MILERLIIKNTINKNEIRNIKFNPKGLSLVSDDGNEAGGSNIGKSTFVKIIDLCLGSSDSPSILYKEKDTGSNEAVRLFLDTNKVQAILNFRIENDFHSVKRDLFNNGKIYIDGKICQKKNYGKLLNSIIFKNDNNLPTLNQLMSKFIRLNSYNEDGLLKYIGQFPRNYEYNAIYNYLFNISKLCALNSELKNDNLKNEKEIKVLLNKNNVNTISLLKGRLEIIDSKLNEYGLIFKEFSTLEAYKVKEKEINTIQSKMDTLKKEVSVYKYKISILTNNKKSELNKVTKINHDKLSEIYQDLATIVGDSLKEFKTYEIFHNKMIQKRIDVLNNVIINTETILKQKEKELNVLRRSYENNYVDFKCNLRSDFEKEYKEYEKTKILYGNVNSDLKYIEKLKDVINKNLSSMKIEEPDNRDDIENEFNQYFEKLTYQILNEKYLIKFNSDSDAFPIQIVGFNGKPGTGTKKSMITCFDLALIEVIMNNKYSMPHFEIHDKMENIALAELKRIVNVGREFEGQYIFPILRDRVIDLDIKDEEIILKLSKDDKLFKI